MKLVLFIYQEKLSLVPLRTDTSYSNLDPTINASVSDTALFAPKPVSRKKSDNFNAASAIVDKQEVLQKPSRKTHTA